jgi:hypothetical protein
MGGDSAAGMQNLGTALAKGGQPRQCRISGAHSSPAQWNLRRESPAPNLMKLILKLFLYCELDLFHKGGLDDCGYFFDFILSIFLSRHNNT